MDNSKVDKCRKKDLVGTCIFVDRKIKNEFKQECVINELTIGSVMEMLMEQYVKKAKV